MAQLGKGKLNYRCPSCFLRDLDIDMFYNKETGIYSCIRCQYRGTEEDVLEKNEARAEEFMTEDAELVLVSYGTTSRIVKEAVTEARKQGIKLGLIRPKTIWPFPTFAFKNCSPKGFLAVEQCVMPQLAEDVALAARKIAPTYSYTTGAGYPRVSNIIDIAEKALAGELKEV